MDQRKPIIGISGGIGSGKSFVADLFGEAGCMVIHADEQVRAAYRDPVIRQTLRSWWGGGVFDPDGEIDRSALAERIFNDASARARLEGLVHPWVARDTDARMARYASDPCVRAFVWDVPLLFETGLDRRCDYRVFVDAPQSVRLQRVATTRGWDESELRRRENLQMPLDRKREMSDYRICNTGDKAFAKQQVSVLLSRMKTGSGLDGWPDDGCLDQAAE